MNQSGNNERRSVSFLDFSAYVQILGNFSILFLIILCVFYIFATFFSIISMSMYVCVLNFGFFSILAAPNIWCFLYYFAFLIIILLTQTIQQMIKQYKCLHYLSQLIPPAFQHSQYKTILKACRPISTLLAYLSKYIHYDLTLSSELQTQLQNCLQVVSVIIKSTQFQKFGHSLPLLAHIINKFSLRKQPAQYRIKSRKQLNMRSPEYVYNKNDEICEREKNFLKSPIFSIVNDEITKNQIILQNPQCICCSLVFVKGMEIFNCNPYYSSVLDICPQSAFDKITVQRHVCALCNQGGGVILIGAQKIDNVLKAVGIKFQSISEIQQKQAEMSQAISWIQPTCHFLIQRLIVHTNYISQENVAEQHLRICFRIIIYSGQQIKINFIQICIKGQQRCYQICYLGQQNKLQIINSSTQQIPASQNFYKMIHSSYKLKKSHKNIHKNIFCFRPHQFYSKIFNDQYNKGLITKEQLEKNTNTNTNTNTNININVCQKNNSNNKSGKSLDQEICFKFKHSCLLIVANVNHDRDVDNFVDQLQEEGNAVSVQRPFPHLFDTSSISSSKRSIWLLCHQTSPSEIRNRLTQYQQSQILKKSSIKILPISTTLQIESTKQGEQEVLRKRIKQRYNQGYKSEIGESYDKKIKGEVKHLKFHHRSQAVFAYLVLEQLGIRPFFIKDNTKKK